MDDKQVVKSEQNNFAVVDLTSELPNLTDATVFPLDFGGEYWTPENKGDNKRVFFLEIKPISVVSPVTAEIIDLECVFFIEQIKEGNEIKARTIYNGSKVLVGTLEPFVADGTIKKGTPLLITYEGKKKNKGNSFQSDRWSVRPLIINIQ